MSVSACSQSDGDTARLGRPREVSVPLLGALPKLHREAMRHHCRWRRAKRGLMKLSSPFKPRAVPVRERWLAHEQKNLIAHQVQRYDSRLVRIAKSPTRLYVYSGSYRTYCGARTASLAFTAGLGCRRRGARVAVSQAMRPQGRRRFCDFAANYSTIVVLMHPGAMEHAPLTGDRVQDHYS